MLKKLVKKITSKPMLMAIAAVVAVAALYDRNFTP